MEVSSAKKSIDSCTIPEATNEYLVKAKGELSDAHGTVESRLGAKRGFGCEPRVNS